MSVVVALPRAESEPAQAAPILPFDFPADGEVDPADPLVRRIIHEVYGAVDFWTRAPLPLDEMHLDHVFPNSLGGPDNVFNLVPTSAGVNIGKSDTFDAVAFMPVLAIVRAVYAPRIMAALARKRRAEQMPGGFDQRVPVMFSISEVRAVDDWRRGIENLPSRSEAIRTLVRIGLATVAKAPKSDGAGKP